MLITAVMVVLVRLLVLRKATFVGLLGVVGLHAVEARLGREHWRVSGRHFNTSVGNASLMPSVFKLNIAGVDCVDM